MLIYAHIPFCESKCPYCSFNSTADFHGGFTGYFDALIAQFHRDRIAASADRFSSLYIGGGTPSIVGAAYYEPFFAAIKPFLEAGAEVTIEANPNSLTIEWAREMKNFGVNRISIGAQSFDDRKLRVLGRARTGSRAAEAIALASAAGFDQVCADLIYGVSGDDYALLTGDLKIAAESGAAHISAYSLTIEEGAAIAKSAAARDHGLERAFSEAIEAAGFPRYEVSNYGRTRSRHNLGYWRGEDYLGLGAGAVGTIALGGAGVKERYEPAKNIAEYISDPLGKTSEIIDAETFNSERLMLALRFCEGFSGSILNAKQRERADILAREGRLARRGGRFFNNDLWLSDEIWLFINS